MPIIKFTVIQLVVLFCIKSAIAAENHAVYVTMPDGVMIAVDLWLPEGASETNPVPTIVEFTRYWRAAEGASKSARVGFFNKNGFAYAIVDNRGSGASFGVREIEFSVQKQRDSRAIPVL